MHVCFCHKVTYNAIVHACSTNRKSKGGEKTRALNAVITMLNTRAVIRLLPFESPPPPKKRGLSLT